MSSPTFRKTPRQTVDFASPSPRRDGRKRIPSTSSVYPISPAPTTRRRPSGTMASPSIPAALRHPHLPAGGGLLFHSSGDPTSRSALSFRQNFLSPSSFWHRAVKLFGVLVDPVVVNFGCFCSAVLILETFIVAASNATYSFHLEK